MVEEQGQEEQRRKSYVGFFAFFGLLWGIASMVFLLTQTGKEEPTNWVLYVIFLPALLNVALVRFLLLVFGGDVLGTSRRTFFIVYLIPILFGILLGWLIGITIDALLIFFKPMEKEGE